MAISGSINTPSQNKVTFSDGSVGDLVVGSGSSVVSGFSVGFVVTDTEEDGTTSTVVLGKMALIAEVALLIIAEDEDEKT